MIGPANFQHHLVCCLGASRARTGEDRGTEGPKQGAKRRSAEKGEVWGRLRPPFPVWLGLFSQKKKTKFERWNQCTFAYFKRMRWLSDIQQTRRIQSENGQHRGHTLEHTAGGCPVFPFTSGLPPASEDIPLPQIISWCCMTGRLRFRGLSNGLLLF